MSNSGRISYSLAVREAVELVLRSGGWGVDRPFAGSRRAREGVEGHRRIQQSRPPQYRCELTVEWIHAEPDFDLRIAGRIDGLMPGPEGWLLEEIKTVGEEWDMNPDPLHWAQARLYGHMVCAREGLPKLQIQLTYLNLADNSIVPFRETFAASALRDFFEGVLAGILQWVRPCHRRRLRRNASLASLEFPFPVLRTGQSETGSAVAEAIAGSRDLLLEAPTGMGKTMAILFAATRALARRQADRIVFLTAKTVGRLAAEQACRELRQKGATLQILTLTARRRICFCVDSTGSCDAAVCPYARGYYDRRRTAVLQTLETEELSQSWIENAARRHRVCPYALALDLAPWVDGIICDYNYVFDARAALDPGVFHNPGKTVLLVDEAHNLVDRARDMFSAELDEIAIHDVHQSLRSSLPACATTLQQIRTAFRRCSATETCAPDKEKAQAWLADLRPRLDRFIREAELWLARNRQADFRTALLEFYFEVLFFRTIADEGASDRYRLLMRGSAGRRRIRLFCLDPAPALARALRPYRSAIFFSATLQPPEYFRSMLGVPPETHHLSLPPAFPPQNLRVYLENRLSTAYRHRPFSLNRVTYAIAKLLQSHPGNYLIFFPSFAYLDQGHRRFTEICPAIPSLKQSPNMSDDDKAAFLARFNAPTTDSAPLAGFAVMGGLFGEGIDLAGNALHGAVIVGVGLPQICQERDLIRDYYNHLNGRGFDYAYAYPGMIRVLQAAGRILRSPEDQGVLLLIDRRFNSPPYRTLLPAWWDPTPLSAPDRPSHSFH